MRCANQGVFARGFSIRYALRTRGIHNSVTLFFSGPLSDLSLGDDKARGGAESVEAGETYLGLTAPLPQIKCGVGPYRGFF